MVYDEKRGVRGPGSFSAVGLVMEAFRGRDDSYGAWLYLCNTAQEHREPLWLADTMSIVKVQKGPARLPFRIWSSKSEQQVIAAIVFVAREGTGDEQYSVCLPPEAFGSWDELIRVYAMEQRLSYEWRQHELVHDQREWSMHGVQVRDSEEDHQRERGGRERDAGHVRVQTR